MKLSLIIPQNNARLPIFFMHSSASIFGDGIASVRLVILASSGYTFTLYEIGDSSEMATRKEQRLTALASSALQKSSGRIQSVSRGATTA